MPKKPKCPECPPVGAPEYMLTYGDMMTLLVTFFVLLISFSSMQEAKFNDAMGSLQGALGVLQAARGTQIKSKNVPMYQYKHEAKDLNFELEKVIEEVKKQAEELGISEDFKVKQSKDRIHFNISNPMLFDSGSAKLNKNAFQIFDEISKVLIKVPYEIRVEGHTDNVPIKTAEFSNNWELSSARALAVVQKLVELSIDPERFQIIGYGEYRPIATNSTEEGRSINRRVDIFLNLKQEMKEEKPDNVFDIIQN